MNRTVEILTSEYNKKHREKAENKCGQNGKRENEKRK